MNEMIENYDTIPDQIAEAVANLDASQLFSVVLNQIIDSIATDNTKSTNAVKVYKKHDLLYATFNETVNLYESLINFTTGSETELIVGTNIREVNISELFIELRKLICDEEQARTQADNALQTNIDNEEQTRTQADNALQTNIDNEAQARTQADNTKVNKSDVLTLEEIEASTDLTGKIASASSLKSIDTRISYLNSYYINSREKSNIKLSNLSTGAINIFYFGSFNNITGFITGHFYKGSEAISENDFYKFNSGTINKVTATISGDNNSITIPLSATWCIGTLMTNVPVTIEYV